MLAKNMEAPDIVCSCVSFGMCIWKPVVLAKQDIIVTVFSRYSNHHKYH
jgi:hypothetical protein